MCNCRKSRVVRLNNTKAAPAPGSMFTLAFPDGRRVKYGSKLEAEAANQRAGGSGTVLYN